MLLITTFLISVFFVLVHLVGVRMRFLAVIPRSAWLSAAGGISVAYVFIHLLPEAETYGRELREQDMMPGLLRSFENPTYLVALLGLVAFYGLERWVICRRGGTGAGRGKREPRHKAGETAPGVFWLHVGSFGLYNALIMYLIAADRGQEPGRMVVYSLALGLHFLVNDFAMREHHRHLYDARGRWVLAMAPPLGWLVGLIAPVHLLTTTVLFGFLCGGIVLNALKEELPAERESQFWAFAAGAVGFAVILVFV